MVKKSDKHLEEKLSTEDINFVEEEALRGKAPCVYGIIQKIKDICNSLRNYDSVKKYLKSLKNYKDKKES